MTHHSSTTQGPTFGPTTIKQLSTFMLTLLASCALPLTAHAAATLVPAKNTQYWLDNEAIKIELTDDVLRLIAAEEMIVELNAINITEMLSQEGKQIAFRPIQKLEPGSHLLRLVHFSADGEVEEMAAWNIDVRSSDLLHSYNFSTNSQLSAIYRAAEDNIAPPMPDRMQGQGSSIVGFSTSTENWQTDGQFDFFYNSRNSEYDDARTLDVGDFVVATESQYIGAKIGHHDLRQHSLVLENFHRRGLSIQGKAPELQSQATVFSFASDDLDGFGEGLGISDNKNRVSGALLESNPIPGKADQFHVGIISLSGKRSTPDFWEPQINNVEQGNSHSIGITSKLFDQHLTLYGEYAETEFDYSNLDQLDAEKDYAHVLSASVQDTLANGLYWNTGIETQTIGTFFKSLANDSLVNDKDQQRLFAATQWKSLGLQINLIQQHDNVEDLSILPTIKTEQNNITTSWSPIIRDPGFWGTPYLSLTLGEQTQAQIKSPEVSISPPVDNQTDYWNSNLNLNYLWGYWGVVLGQSNYQDHSYNNNDSESDSIETVLSYSTDQWSLNPRYKWQETDYLGVHQAALNSEWQVIASHYAFNRRLTTSLEYRLNQYEISNDLQDEQTESTVISINWMLKQADHNDFGFDLGLSAQANDFENRLDRSMDNDDYQIFISLTASLSTKRQN